MNASTGRLLGTVAAVVVGLCATAAMAQITSYPYTNGFEVESLGAKPSTFGPGLTWTTNSGGTVYVTNSTAAGGAQSCMIAADDLNLNTTNASVGTRSNIWVRFFCKPTAYDDAYSMPSVANCSAAFYVSTGGGLYAYADLNGLGTGGGNGWTNVASGVPTNQWLGFTVHLDYSNQLWDLYYTTGSTGATMGKTYGAPLVMATQHSNRLWQTTFSSGATSHIDEVSIANGYTELAYGNESPTNVQYLASLSISRGKGTRGIGKYFGPSSDTLSQDLGGMLSRVLSVNDQIRIFFPEDGWGIYTNKSTYWSWYSGSGRSPSSAHVTRTTGVWIDNTTATGVVTVAVDGFAPYNTTDATNTAVYGSGTAGGWNLFQWPYAARSVNDAVKGIGFTNAVTGDLMFVYDDATKRYTQLWYNSTAGMWMYGGRSSSYILQEGELFWYKRVAAGNVTWAIYDKR